MSRCPEFQKTHCKSCDTPCRLMITHTIESYRIASQKKTKSNLQIQRICQNSNSWLLKQTSKQHTLWSCLICCANLKWIRRVSVKMQGGHDAVHRRTDGQGETSILPFQLCWSRGYNDIALNCQLGSLNNPHFIWKCSIKPFLFFFYTFL